MIRFKIKKKKKNDNLYIKNKADNKLSVNIFGKTNKISLKRFVVINCKKCYYYFASFASNSKL